MLWKAGIEYTGICSVHGGDGRRGIAVYFGGG